MPSIGSKVQSKSLQYKSYSKDSVAKHNKKDDLWLIIHGKVYDVTHFLEDHPGGPEIIEQHGGEDCTAEFEEVFHSEGARKQLADFIVGDEEGFKGSETALMDQLKKSAKSGSAASSATATQSGSSSTMLILALVGATAAAAYFLL